ncbi:MAG: copper chaperone PCu(A)C [Gammaproteobacteria bacterium]|nr:copper chaperone PCu(A)C [Gammaproteobacteria bacterium]
MPFPAPAVEVTDAWVAEMPPGAGVTAGYLVIHNPSRQAVTLLAVSTPQFHDVQLHLSEVRDGTAMMRMQASIEIPGGGSLHLAPGGYHLMMSDPRSPLRSGDTVSLRLEFSDGSVVSAEAPVKRLSAGAR